MIWRLMDHDVARHPSEPFRFAVNDQTLSGTLWLPDGPPVTAVALVHGDGPQDRVSGGAYAPLINILLDQGIAVASWDKPGIGASEGAWRTQSMADRTVEAQAAMAQLQHRFDGIALGAMGFSQAGWVLPHLTEHDADFQVLVGPAVSWQAQGAYFTRTRLERSGLTGADLTRAIAAQDRANDRAFGPGAHINDRPADMAPDRWRFIRTNRMADARDALSQLRLPLLAIWGANDLNVDAHADAATCRLVMRNPHPATERVLWPDATHGLLKAGPYNWQLTQDWSRTAKLRFAVEGRYAYAPGALATITDWIIARASARPPT
ncbi:MAG: alpha/beta hydrolase [Pseudomonadota bacterium]